MIDRFEVFQIRFDGGVRWLGALSTIEKARDRVKQSSRQDSKMNHVINDIKTGAYHDFRTQPIGRIRCYRRSLIPG